MNNSWLSFDPVFPFWTIALSLGLSFAFFIWNEIYRSAKFLIARIIALLLILLSMVGLLTRPSYREEKNSAQILLLTAGYDKQKVDSIIQQNDVRVVRTQNTNPYPNAEVLTSDLRLSEIAADVTIITGQGLPDYALDLVDQKLFKFIPAATPDGIIDLSVPKPLIVNKRSSVAGIIRVAEKTTLKLIGPAGVEDSVVIKSRGQFPFDLSFTPKQTGLFVYSLEYRDATHNVKEKLPLEITGAQKLNILLLQKFPTAEVRYLKNYLAEKGHALALRYQTSKTNFRYEYANTNPIRVDRLTPELTSAFDLVLVDNTVLEELPSSERIVLQKAITNGLGAIVLADAFPAKGKIINQFLPFQVKPLAIDTVHMRFKGSKLYNLPFVPVEIIQDGSIVSTMQHNGLTLSGYVHSGAGKIGLQLLKETYRISLEGNEDVYSFIWSDLIERVGRSKNKMFEINLSNPFPYYTDEPLAVDIISAGERPVLYADKNLIPVAEDVVIDDYWHAKSWAGNIGWHQFVSQDSTKVNYFVSDKGEWESLRVANQIKHNLLVQSSSSVVIGKNLYRNRLISPVLFYLIFLFAAGFLWLAPKI